jgi:hypothetical protein
MIEAENRRVAARIISEKRKRKTCNVTRGDLILFHYFSMHLPLLIRLIGNVWRLLHMLRRRLGDVDLRRVHHLMMGMNHFPSILNC